jgi:hypothetical protein
VEKSAALTFCQGAKNTAAFMRKVVDFMFSLIIAILLIVLLAKCIGFVGAKTDEVKQRTKKRH